MLLIAILATMVATAWTALVVFVNGMRTSSNGVVIGKGTIIAAWCLALFFWCAWGLDRANAADLYQVERISKSDRVIDRPHIGAFGVYRLNYMQRRWARMCRGPQRYDAMRESYEYNGSQPCR